MSQHRISESDATKLAMEWALSRLGHSLSYYSGANALLKELLPKYNEAMDEIESYNQSLGSERD